MQDYKETVRKENNDYIRALNESANQQIDTFDGAIMKLNAGALSVSFAFIEKIVPVASALYKTLLVISWACFSLALVLQLASFLLSYHFSKKQSKEVRKNTLDIQNGKSGTYKQISFVPVDVLNLLNYALFVGGIVCLILFIGLNLR